MAGSSAVFAGTTVHNTYGALLIGFSASCVVFGVVCTQTWTYFQRYPLDRPFYKILVVSLLTLELAGQVLIGHSSYYYAITNWGNPRVLLLKPVWSLVLQVLLGALAGVIVKFCFAMRVWRFSNGSYLVTSVISLLALAQLVFACMFTIRGFAIDSLTHIHELKLVGSLSLILGVCVDLVTASALTFYLHKLRTGYKRDNSLVNKLTLYAVNTGILTTAVSLATMILYNIMPENFIFMGCYFVLSKLYLNSFLATLNTRRVLRGRGTDAETNTMPTFLMVGKLTKHQPNEYGDHVYPPSYQSPIDKNTAQGQLRSVEIGVEQEITISRDSQYDREYTEFDSYKHPARV